MKYLKLFEDYKSDVKNNNIAKNIYKFIVKNINNIEFKPTDETDFIKTNSGKIIQLIGIKFNLKQLDRRFNVEILLINVVYNHAAFFDEKNNKIGFGILGDTDDFEHNLYLGKLRFKSWIEENIFVHEFIHYLDSLKYKYNFPKNHKNLYDYYNSPHEYNAYYNELLNKLLKNKPKIKSLTSKVFLKYALDLMEFTSFLSDENLKKLKTRLYKLWSRINKK